jgi:hypothetical protein
MFSATIVVAQGNPATMPGVMLSLQDATGVGAELGPGQPATRAQITTFRTALLGVTAVLQTMPFFAKPVGFSTAPQIGLNEPGSGAWRNTKTAPLVGYASLTAYEHFVDQAGKLRIVAMPLRGDDRPGATLTVLVNSLGCVFSDAPYFTDGTGPVYISPGPMGLDEHGNTKAAKCVFVTQRKLPIVVPVTRERVLQHAIADATDAVKEIETMQAAVPAARRADYAKPVAERRARLSKLQGILSAMSASDRAAAAVINLDPETIFASEGDATRLPIVDANPKFFDVSRLDQIQVLAVRFGLSSREGEYMPQINWPALLNLAR